LRVDAVDGQPTSTNPRYLLFFFNFSLHSDEHT